MAECHTCGKIVDIEATVCNSCGRPNPTKMRKGEGCASVIGIFFAILIALAMWAYARYAPISSNNHGFGSQAPEPVVVADSASISSPDQPTSNTDVSDIAPAETTEPNISEATEERHDTSKIASVNEALKEDNSAPKQPALNTYYFLVSKDGVSQTVSLAAPDPEKAKEVLRKFRGNPDVLQGPSNSVEW